MRLPHDTVALIRNLRPAGIPLVAGLSLLLILSACVPAAIAVSLGAIVSSLRQSTDQRLFTALLLPLAAFGVVVLTGHLADAGARPLEFQARARIDGHHRSRILELTTGAPSIVPLENPVVQRLIRQSSAESDFGVATLADGALAQLRWLAGLIGAGAGCFVLARYAWWLVPLLLAPASVALYLSSRQYFAAAHALQFATREELHTDVWRHAAASSAEGKDVRIFGFADWMVARMQLHIDIGNAPLWTNLTRAVQRSWQQFGLALLALLPAYLLVTRSAARGSTTIAVQTAVLIAGWSVLGSIGSSDGVYQIVSSVEVMRAFDQLQVLISLPPDGELLADGAGLDANQAGDPPLVRFDEVRFGYPGTEAVVLDRLTLEIRPGELLALVGLNGAGKSTLIKLLAGLYTPDAGQISADGVEISTLGWASWRRRISVVFQDFIHYELSAADNVTLGQSRVPADRAAAAAAAGEAGFDEVLHRLPAGWDTPLARTRSGGVELSGGQWQQVALARALYAVRKGARLLVLDEPTAHLDVRTEFEVFRRLAERRGNTSVVLISHRLSTVREADRIVLLDGGRITETGSHQELMALDGGYAKLFTLQSRSFQLDDDETGEGVSR